MKTGVARKVTKQPIKKAKTDDNGIVLINTYSKWFNVALILLCFFFLLGMRLQINNPTTGDEPYYLLMDYSMIHDHDLSLTNNFVHKDFTGFYEGTFLGPQGTPRTSEKYIEKGYSTHQEGLPLFLLPGFIVAAKTGAVFELALLATCVVWLTWLWTRRVTNNRKAAYLAAGLLAVCYYFANLVGAIYPDMLIAAITLCQATFFPNTNLGRFCDLRSVLA